MLFFINFIVIFFMATDLCNSKGQQKIAVQLILICDLQQKTETKTKYNYIMSHVISVNLNVSIEPISLVSKFRLFQGPKIDPWGIPDTTGRGLDSTPSSTRLSCIG